MSSNPAWTCPTFSMESHADCIRIFSLSPSRRDCNCFSLSGVEVRSCSHTHFVGCSAELVGKTYQLPEDAVHLFTQRPHEWGSVSISQSSNNELPFLAAPSCQAPSCAVTVFVGTLRTTASLSSLIVGACWNRLDSLRTRMKMVSWYKVTWWLWIDR